MRKKKIIKSIFVTMLSFIFLSLSIISVFGFKDNITTSTGKLLYSEMKYQIIYKDESCSNIEKLIYKENNTEYYLECHKIESIYIQWENGEISKLEESINDKKVTINSLIEHGLDIKVVKTNEN